LRRGLVIVLSAEQDMLMVREVAHCKRTGGRRPTWYTKCSAMKWPAMGCTPMPASTHTNKTRHLSSLLTNGSPPMDDKLPYGATFPSMPRHHTTEYTDMHQAKHKQGEAHAALPLPPLSSRSPSSVPTTK
jgi:hypothetical protein